MRARPRYAATPFCHGLRYAVLVGLMPNDFTVDTTCAGSSHKPGAHRSLFVAVSPSRLKGWQWPGQLPPAQNEDALHS
jgi:hypothetical protein